MADISASTWNPVDEANTAISPLGFADGNSPNKLAAKIRSMSGAIKRGWEEANAIYTSTGTASAYVVTFAQAAPSYVKGKFITFFPHATNTGAATINVNALGAKTILRGDGTALVAGDILVGQSLRVYYDGTNFRIDGAVPASPTFSGTVTANAVNATTFTGNGAGVTNVNAASVGGIALTGLVQVGRQIIAGNGLTGGGDHSADRTITLGTPSSISTSTTNTATATSHTHDLVLTQADINALYGYTPANSTVTLTASSGLTGGGTIAGNRAFALGTPTGINGATGNTLYSTSHTHNIDSEHVVATGMISMSAYALGSHVFAITVPTITVNFWTLVAGSNLHLFATQSGANSEAGSTLPGTWRCCGYANGSARYATVYVRVG